MTLKQRYLLVTRSIADVTKKSQKDTNVVIVKNIMHQISPSNCTSNSSTRQKRKSVHLPLKTHMLVNNTAMKQPVLTKFKLE
jgi:hypothetical protein